MTASFPPMMELSRRARQALEQELGVIDTLRFLGQFRAGHGDYTAQREPLLRDESVSSLAAAIRSARNRPPQP